MTLNEIVVAMGVVYGDLCRQARDGVEDDELKKELGNMIVSSIRWCDDLGLDPNECIEKALAAQKKFARGKQKTP